MNLIFYVLFNLILYCFIVSGQSNTTTFPQQGIGPCTCDLTSNTCDIGCCCDSDCTAADIQSFIASCKAFSFANVQTCLPTNLFFRYTTPFKANASTPNTICFYKDDYTTRNSYNVPVMTNNASDVSRIYNSYNLYQFPTISYNFINFKTLKDDFYKSEGPVFVFFPTNTAGQLSLPTVQSSNACGEELAIRYLVDQSVTCTQAATNCLNSPYLSAANFVNNFKIVSLPSVFKSMLNRTEIITTVNGSVEINVTSTLPYDAPGMLSINVTNVTCSQGSACNISDLNPQFNDTTNECSNILQSINYNIVYNGTFGIISVGASIVLGTVTSTSIQQTFSVTFTPLNGVAGTPKSGNPGYLVGKPVLAGKLVTAAGNQQSIQVASDPQQQLTVVAGGLCSNTSSRTTVTFGYNLNSGCLVQIDKSLASKCWDLQGLIIQSIQGTNLPDRIASFGNSLTTKVDDWVPIITKDLTGSPSSFPGGCSQIIIGAELSILWARAGSLTNAQNRIIGAELKYVKGDIKYSCYGGACLNDSNAVQTFTISMGVTFVDTSVTGGPPAATDAISLSRFEDDFLYMFYVENVSPSVYKSFFKYQSLIFSICALTLLRYST